MNSSLCGSTRIQQSAPMILVCRRSLGLLLLTNRCRHKLYRDDLRDLLLGRHHAVQKLLPGSLVCTKRLVLEASPPPRQQQEP